MNFFESQDTAKRNTKRLILLFALAVISLIVITNVLVMLVFGIADTQMTTAGSDTPLDFDVEMFLIVSAAVTGIVLIGSLYKIGALSGGGASIAEMMNGRLLVSGGDDLHERQVLNVVEEMAIASGTPVPPVYLIEEDGINAFAAGYSTSDAVIGVTRGAITSLSREQLQGVIAHEFSHILHGDMRINIRLMGVLHGILVLGIIGHHLLRGGARGHRSSKGTGGIMALGLGLVVVGFVGTLFGNMIKAAVSRQREYLADASAVQFTRNPDGIAGALMQISQHSSHSHLDNPSSEEISHSLFGEGRASRLSSLYATHPPLEQRIGAILPNWDGNYDLAKPPPPPTPEPAQQAEQAAGSEPRDRRDILMTAAAGVLMSDALINQAGSPDERHLQQADAIRKHTPQPYLDAARDLSGARAVIYALLLSNNQQTRHAQLELIKENADVGVFEELAALDAAEKTPEPDERMALVEISLARPAPCC